MPHILIEFIISAVSIITQIYFLSIIPWYYYWTFIPNYFLSDFLSGILHWYIDSYSPSKYNGTNKIKKKYGNYYQNHLEILNVIIVFQHV